MSNMFFFKKKRHFHFSVSFSTFLIAFWLPIFDSAEPSLIILSIDRTRIRLLYGGGRGEGGGGGKITKKLKYDRNFGGFC